MIGNLLINVLSGCIGFLFTFFVTYSNNLLMTSLTRGVFAFIVWFLLAFLLRWVLGSILQPSAPPEEAGLDQDSAADALGGQLDVRAPDEDEELLNLLKQKPGPEEPAAEDFKPLQPPKLVSMKDPEELAKAVRHLKEE
ncbi:hypothetical protein [Paenibacillus donghaensis]|nr:hypothetical protein [Paenibacillus donghaensis]